MAAVAAATKWRMLRAKRFERAPGRLRHSRRLHHRCDGGPLVSRWDASSSSAPPTLRARSLLICERRSRKQGARQSWSMPASARRAATSTLRAARSPPIIPPARIFWAAPIAARRWRQWEGVRPFVSTRGDIDAMLGIGGSGDRTFIVTKGMQSLRIGVPKADGFNARRRRCRTLCRCRGHIDLAGLNNISRTVLRDAAFGIVGMASAGPAAGTGKPPIVLTMLA
jgi:hypothetical protein